MDPGESSSLVVFLKQLEDAIENQRHRQNKLDFDSSITLPMYKTPLPIGKNYASVYTLSVFYEVQADIEDSVYFCMVVDCKKCGDIHDYTVRSVEGNDLMVKHTLSSNNLDCSCNKFVRVGLPCCHMISVWRTLGVHNILEKYICSHWMKDSLLKPTFDIDDSVLKEGAELDGISQLKCELLSEIHIFANMIENDSEAMKNFLSLLKREKTQYMKTVQQDKNFKTSKFENFLGPIPEKVEILPPPQAKTKGRPTTLRLKGVTEIIRAQASKEQRLCSKCNLPGHNSRTCKKIIEG